MFEKLIKISILNFLTKNKILKTCQFGFREYTSILKHILIVIVIYKSIMIDIARKSLLILKKHFIHYIIPFY